MKKRVLTLSAVAAVAAMTLSGCTATADGNNSGKDIASLVTAGTKTSIDELVSSLGDPKVPSGVKLCYVTRTLNNEFWGYEISGFEAKAKELGVDFQTFAVKDEASITEQIDKAKSALNQGCSALLASPISATALDAVFTEALSKGIPSVVLNDAKGTLPGVVYIGPDALSIGQSAADYIAKLLPEGGDVAMIEGDPGSSNAQNRGIGFKEGLKAYSNLTLVASQTAKWDAAQAQSIATAMLTAHPNIKAFYSQNDGMAIGIKAAIEAKGLTGKVLLVGTDGIPQAKKEIVDGNMTATVSEKPFTEGGVGIIAALWLLDGKTLPEWVEVPAFVIDKDNVADYPTGMP